MMTIDAIWNDLRQASVAAQRRVDAHHPRDLYADFEPPDQAGLVAICGARPAPARPMRAIGVDVGRRSDGRWSLRLQLHVPALSPVFTALCKDIIAFTATGVDESELAPAVMGRLQRWRSLLERDTAGLEETTLRGLIGELTVLRGRLLPRLSPREAVDAWKGPLGAPQDFLLQDGSRIEVKAVNWDAATVRINGLAQLDSEPDDLMLAVVRLQVTASSAPGALTAPVAIERTRTALNSDADAEAIFDECLAAAGWHEHPSHGEFAVRPIAIHAHPVTTDFPRLVAGNVPCGVEDVVYEARLPVQGFEEWPLTND